MRYLTYEHDGAVYHGALDPEDASDQVIVQIGQGSLLNLLERETIPSSDPQAHLGGPRVARSDVKILAPLPRPPKLLAVAANYEDHVRGGGGEPVDPETATPRLFLKPSSAIIPHDGTIELPKVSAKSDWEVELAVVIGQRCRNVPEDRALDVVAGYMTANDVSVRSFDFGFERDEKHIHGFMDWLAGKWPDGFAPFGPYLVSADEIDDPHDLDLHLDVNGEVFQQGSTGSMIFKIPQLIAYASSFMTLEPGDVIETGTPAGTGVESGRRFLEPGDVMNSRVGKLGVISNPIVAPSG